MERIVEKYFMDSPLSGKSLNEYLKNKVVPIITQNKSYIDRYINPYIENKIIYISYENITPLKILYGFANIRLTEFGVEYMENINSINKL